MPTGRAEARDPEDLAISVDTNAVSDNPENDDIANMEPRDLEQALFELRIQKLKNEKLKKDWAKLKHQYLLEIQDLLNQNENLKQFKDHFNSQKSEID